MGAAFPDDAAGHAFRDRGDVAPDFLGPRAAPSRNPHHVVIADRINADLVGPEQPLAGVEDCLEHRSGVGRRLADNPQYPRRRRLLAARFRQFGLALRERRGEVLRAASPAFSPCGGRLARQRHCARLVDSSARLFDLPAKGKVGLQRQSRALSCSAGRECRRRRSAAGGSRSRSGSETRPRSRRHWSGGCWRTRP